MKELKDKAYEVTTLTIEEARKLGLNPMHIDLRFLKPFDKKVVLKATEMCRRIITVEDGTLVGGLFSTISEFVASWDRFNILYGFFILLFL